METRRSEHFSEWCKRGADKLSFLAVLSLMNNYPPYTYLEGVVPDCVMRAIVRLLCYVALDVTEYYRMLPSGRERQYWLSLLDDDYFEENKV
jgi:hypothetical protein